MVYKSELTQVLDSDSFNLSIGGGSAEQLTVDVPNSSDIYLFIDDGSTGTAPQAYDLLQEYKIGEFDDYMFYDKVSDSTSRQWTDPSFPHLDHRVTITNKSGSSGQFRAALYSVRRF